MNFNTTEVFGLSDSLEYFIRDLYEELSGLGIDVEALLTDLEEKKQYAKYINCEQEKMNAVQKELASRAQDALTALYDTSSAELNAVIGAIGRKSGHGKKTEKIRGNPPWLPRVW